MTTISIITVTHNAATTIGNCLQSLAAQTHPFEHIIIDGASTDATLEIARGISPFCRIVSESDRGIYDAMNKGIALATGEVVGILNADDFYASPQVLEKIAHVFRDPAVEACYADLEYVKFRETMNNDREKGIDQRTAHSESLQDSALITQSFQVVRYWKSGAFSPNRFKWGWMPPHPTFFVRRSVYERYGTFRFDMGSAADYELMLRFLFRHGITTVYIPEVLVRMRVGGASNATLAARFKANRMDKQAWRVNGLKPYPWTLLCKPLRKIFQYNARNTT